jgi:hypothetical protein
MSIALRQVNNRKKWLDPRTRKPVERKQIYGFPSPNNKDIEWLQERTTSKIE